MKTIWIATVQIAIEADTPGEAADAMSGCLTENLMGNGAILDWQYLSVGRQILVPTDTGAPTRPDWRFED